jgi:proton-dependent oligopeptide transporter, POT family
MDTEHALAAAPIVTRPRHGPGLAVLAFTEGCERFSFYGMQALLTLYMLDYLLHPEHAAGVPGLGLLRRGIEAVYGPQTTAGFAAQIFGLYTAGVYLTPVLGSLAADRWLGRTRAIVIGCLLMVAGHFAMAFDAGFVVALLLLIAGCGFVKGNIATQVGELYEAHDPRRTDAYQVFVLAINIGVIAAPLVCGTLGERVGFHYGFAAAGVGMAVAAGIYLAGRGALPAAAPRARQAARRVFSAADWHAMAAQGALVVLMAFAFVSNNQIYGMYPIWARDHAQLSVYGRTIPVTWLASLDATVSCSLLPVAVLAWRWAAKRGITPHELTKLVGGAACGVLAPLLLATACWATEAAGQKVSLPVLILFHLVNGLAFVHLYPVGLALVSRTAPAGLNATMVGIYYLLFVGTGLIVGRLGALYGTVPNPEFWLIHAACVGVAAVGLAILYRPLRRALA